MGTSASGPPAAMRSRGGVWVLTQMLAMLAVLLLGWFSVGHEPGLPGGMLAGGLLGLSAILAVVGTVNLGRNLSPHPQPHARTTLIQHGIYGWVRHPLYLSLVVAAVGWALLRQSLAALLAALVLALVLDAKARAEERWLRERFPEYETYARRVRRWLPWVY